MAKRFLSILLVVGLVVGSVASRLMADNVKARVLFDAQDYIGARAEYDKTLADKDSKVYEKEVAFQMKGESYFQEKEYVKAIDEYAKVFACEDDFSSIHSSAWYATGLCYDKLGDKDSAQEAYKNVLLERGQQAQRLNNAFNKIDFRIIKNDEGTIMTRAEVDAFLLSAYDAIADRGAQNEAGEYIFAGYISKLVNKMSKKAQAEL